MVVDERENIVPGFVQPLTTKLDPGEYEMTCGLLSNPRGTLRSPRPPRPRREALAARPRRADRRVQGLCHQGGERPGRGDAHLRRRGEGRPDRGSPTLYAPARLHYERIEPIAELFSDLDGSIDARADDFEQKEAGSDLDRLPPPREGAVRRPHHCRYGADRRQAAWPTRRSCRSASITLTIPPKAMVGGAGRADRGGRRQPRSAARKTATATPTSGTSRRNVDGAQKIVELLRPLLQPGRPELVGRLDANFAKVDAMLAKYTRGRRVRELREAERRRPQRAQGAGDRLAEDLARLRGTLGVD